MEEFRRAILEKFSTVKEAFETFMKDLPDRPKRILHEESAGRVC